MFKMLKFHIRIWNWIKNLRFRCKTWKNEMELNFYFFPVQVAFGERSQVSKDFTRNIKIKRDDNQQLNLGLYKLLFLFEFAPNLSFF